MGSGFALIGNILEDEPCGLPIKAAAKLTTISTCQFTRQGTIMQPNRTDRKIWEDFKALHAMADCTSPKRNLAVTANSVTRSSKAG
jgi:hypothetical protein